MSKDNLRDQIWATRISRINAEKRLIKKETFFQGINIYYSCITIIFSILTLIYTDEELNLMTVFMTICLLIVILYLNSQKYLEHAREYRKNYTQLHLLELDLNYMREDDEEKIKQIEKDYCNLLDSSSNHISFDYYCTVYGSNAAYKESRWKNVRLKFYFGKVWRAGVIVFVIVVPIALYIFCRGI